MKFESECCGAKIVKHRGVWTCSCSGEVQEY